MATTTQPKPPPAVRALRKYDEEYLECRRGNLGHVWHVVGFYRGPDGTVIRSLECGRCGTAARDRWGRDGERIQRQYAYVEGYQIPTEGEEGITAADVRVEVIRRAHVYANEEQMLAHLTGGN
jgi:hypothetical protein